MRKNFLVFVLVISLVAIACRFGSSAAQRPGPEILVSTEEAQQFEHILKDATDSFSNTGEVNIQITETQLTSYVYFQIQQQDKTGITDPQIFLRDGKIQMYAKYSESTLPVNLELVITPQLSDGGLILQLDSVRLGPAAAPKVLVEQAQQIITEQIEPGLNQSVAGGFYIDTLSIADGVLTLHGKKP